MEVRAAYIDTMNKVILTNILKLVEYTTYMD